MNDFGAFLVGWAALGLFMLPTVAGPARAWRVAADRRAALELKEGTL